MSSRKDLDRGASHDDPRTGYDRRRFVGLVGASLAAGWLADGTPQASAATIGAPSVLNLVPGYLRESYLLTQDESTLLSLSDFRTPLHETVRPVIPEQLPLEFVSSTDPGEVPVDFETGRLRIWVHGLLPPGNAGMGTGIEAVHLGAEIHGETDGPALQHYVWGFREGPVENLSGPTTFEVALTHNNVIRLVTTFENQTTLGFGGRNLRSGSAGQETACWTDFSLGDRRDQPRLRPGVYCLPLSDAAQTAFPLAANYDWLVPEDLPYLLFSVQSLD